MKRAFLVFLCLCIALGLCACTGKEIENGKITVVSTVFPSYDFVREIAEDKVNNILLLAPGKDSHSYDPSARDIINIENCELFIHTGGISDAWVDTILSSAKKEKSKVITMTTLVTLYADEHEYDGHGEHGHENEYDEHVWTSPENAKLIAEEICKKLCDMDKENADFYTANTKDFIARLTKLDRDIKNTVENGKRKFIAVADRFPLIYFAKHYGLDYVSAFPGCSSKTEPSPSTLASLTEAVKEKSVPVIFKIELSDGAVAKAVSEQTGTEILTFYTLHNVSKEDLENGEGYISLMEKNAQSLKIALN